MYRFALALLLAGCVHIRTAGLYSDFYNAEQNMYVDLRQCEIPITISFVDLSDEDANQARKSLNLWESYAGKKLFVEDYPARVLVMNYDGIYYGETAALTHNEWDRNGCIFASTITLNLPLGSLNALQGQFILAHEIGHVLGFADSDDKFHLMYGNVGLNVDRPSASEIEALRRMY
jgi:hypothetical protein